MQYLPIHFDTRGANILVVGGGPAAEAKLRTLLKTEANLIVVDTSVGPEVSRWASQGKLNWEKRDYRESDLDGASLVYAATEDDALNATIAASATARQIPVNAADQKAACRFITPALVDRAPVLVSIGTEGTSPALARALKAELETILPPETGAFALKTKVLREKVKALLPDLADRQRFWARILGGKDLSAQLRVSPEGLESQVEMELAGQDDIAGKVLLVGAGPGDPDMLTTAARRALHAADVIVYDRLVSDGVLELGRREAEYIYVGKTPGEPSIGQTAINQILIDKATEGLSVVRLKSGDPLIFGRADEEIDALSALDIPVQIIPGITSAAAAAAAINASLTTRGTNRAVSLLTGHDAKGFAEQDWASLARPGGRAAVYMGVGASRFIQGRLMLHGAEGDRPVTVVENASRPNQIITYTTLRKLPDDIAAAGIKGPAILLIGYAERETISSERLAV
ncbi:siroheme synthase 3 [Litorimonas cladophorae]|uniref:Siroheme synthase 3 n=1 Tax=Litorimonas cladophorae TaxID=1220491 RepID=A0A918NBT8_9PROT|nr:siroheme synthase CysG [Litorimonas cladophorae]GGX58922.1 siroheme synthase 3 [Litorimonas cladophorae]